MLQMVAECCPTKIFLANPDMDRTMYGEAFHLNDTELELIAGLVPLARCSFAKRSPPKKFTSTSTPSRTGLRQTMPGTT